MSFTKTLLEGPIPKPLFWTLVPISAIVLVSLFVFLGFPYDALGARFAHGAQDRVSRVVHAVVRSAVRRAPPGCRERRFRASKSALRDLIL